MVTIPPELRESLKKGECVLFVGAGLSKGLPQWTELVEPLAKEMGISPDTDPRKIASYYEGEKGRKALEDKIILALKKKVPLTETHRLLASLPLKAIITTNYDNLLERALSQSNYIKIVDGREAPLARQDQIPLIKMHGDLETPSTIVITQRDYDDYPEKHRPLIQYVMGFLISCNFFFVGYSLNDQSFHIMHSQARSLFERSMRRSFAIFENPPPLEVKRLENESNIGVIPVGDYDRDIPEIFRELHEYCSGRRPSQLTAPDIQDIRRAFCGVVKSQTEWLDPRGIFQFDHMLTKGEVALEEVYVVPRLQKQIRKRRDKSTAEEKVIDHEDCPEKREGLKNLEDTKKSLDPEVVLEASAEEELELQEYVFEQQVELSLKDVLSDVKNNHMVILGDPGIGKSCLLQYIALKTISDPKLLGINVPLLPVILPLREYKRFGQDKMLREFLFHYVENRICALTEEELEELLEKNMFFLLLDGLDEVISESERIQVSRQVEQFMGRYQNTKIILTSRPSGYKTARLVGAVPHFRLAEFNDSEIREFLVKWFSYLDQIEKEFDSKEVEEKADRLKDKIFEKEKIIPLARNPLLLTILVLVHRVGKTLPERRAEFYEYAVRTVAGTWERWKGLHPERKIPDQEIILRILEKVGFDLHKEKPENMVETDELRKWLVYALQEEMGHSSSEEVEDFIWMLNERAGLLVEKGFRLYGFTHLTFQEYFAARHIAIGRGTGQVGPLIRKYLYKNRWKEVFLLAAGIAPPEQADLIFSSILEAENLFENYVHSNLLFAGEALADQPRLSDSRRKSVIDQLIGLTSPNYIDLLRLDALEILGKIRKVMKFSDSWAFDLLRDENSDVRRAAIAYFIRTGVRDEQVTSRFFELLKDEDLRIRRAAIAYFIRTGVRDEQVTSRFFELLKDSDPGVRRGAIEYFIRTGAGAGVGDEQVTSRFFEMLRDSDPGVRWTTVEYFAKIGAGDEQVTSRFFEMLRDSDPGVRWTTVEYFAKTGVRDEQATSRFFELLKDSDPDVRRAAIEYFAKTGSGDEQVTSRVIELLKDEYPDVRWSAIEYFIRTGAGDEQVTSRVIELLKDEYLGVRWSAIEYFAKTGDEQVTSRVIELLKDEDPRVKWSAIEYFIRTGAGDEQVTSRVIELLRDSDPDVRRAAIEYFAKTGDEQVTSRVIELLRDSDPDVRRAAIEYFAKTGSGDEQVTSRVIELLRDEYPDVRRAAIEYFAKTGAGDEQVTSRVIELLKDESFDFFPRKTNQQIAVDYLSKYAKDESSRKASRLFQEGDYSLKRGAYKLMKALLASE